MNHQDQNTTRGVYFMSNNRMYELTIAFLNSFRKHNPDIALCLVPYNSDCDKILALREKYNFQVFSNSEMLTYCDNVSLRFHDRIEGAYRKLAMWEGPFDEFIYIDVDTVVLASVSFSFEHLSEYDCFTSHSDMPELRRFVWTERIYESNALDEMQIAFSANTGFITSRKGFLSLADVAAKLEDAVRIKDCMELRCQEQAFLNYMIVTAGKPFTSLFSMAQKNYQNLFFEIWAGLRGGKVRGGQFKGNYRIFLVHWAGLWRAQKIDHIKFKLLKILGLADACDEPVLNGRMPYKKLWKYYRNMSA